MPATIRNVLRSEDKTALGVLVVLLTLVVVAAVNTGFLAGLFVSDGDIIRARFSSTDGLKKGDKVRVKGIDVGQVKKLTLDPGGRTATVEMTVSTDAQPIRRDARAFIRWRTVLGGNFAVDLDPGTNDQPDLGSGVIPVTRTQNQIELDEVISFVKGAAKRGLRSTLAEVPKALQNPDAPASTFRELADVSPSLAKAISAVRGIDEEELAPLIKATSKTVRALDTPTNSIRDVIEGAAVTTRVTAARQDELRRLLSLTGTVQPRIRSTLTALSSTLDEADPVLAHLRPAAGDVAPTLAALKPTVIDADRLLTDARPVVRSLRPAVTSLAAAARDGAPLLDEITPSVKRAAGTILPDLAVKDPVSKLKTYEMIGPVIASLNGAASSFDAEGHLFRFPALGGERALSDTLPCGTYFTDPEAAANITCDSFDNALNSYLGFLTKPTGPRP